MEAKPESAKKDSTPKDGEGVATVLETIPIKNDGSFMERFLQMQKEQEEAKAREAELAKKGPAQSRKTNVKPTSSVAAAPPKSSSATKEVWLSAILFSHPNISFFSRADVETTSNHFQSSRPI
eukprot:TRINITY_DN11_c0_g1_i2.p1 TRINITY_DN11_c0_g1~~TRINITY_DN11_c0_g1_i2.p1  ORF type:complete len:123 (-),score=33.98 TRINITY_DN11_c0_g1_i2:839-1207(-)